MLAGNNCKGFTVSKPILRAAIFDLDGTLIDSEPNYYEADRRLLADYGVDFSVEMKKRFVGSGNVEMIQEVKRMYDLPDSVDVLLDKKNRYYMEIAEKSTQAFPEMRKLVMAYHEAGVPLAVASGSSPDIIEKLTRAVGLIDCFDLLISSEEVERAKPEPDVFLEAAKKLSVEPASCIVFEDSRYGVMAGKAAGMTVVAIPTDPDDPLPEPFYRADLLFEKGMEQFTAKAVLDRFPLSV